jgi:hypothetical protein
LRRRLDPYPATSFGCSCPLTSPRAPASRHGKRVRHVKVSLQCNFNREPSFGAAVIR